MTKILEYHALAVAKAPSKAAQQALAIVKSAVRVAGSAPLAAAPEVISAPSAWIATGEWVASRDTPVVKGYKQFAHLLQPLVQSVTSVFEELSVFLQPHPPPRGAPPPPAECTTRAQRLGD